MNSTAVIIGLIVGIAWLTGCILILRRLKNKKVFRIVITAILFTVFAAFFLGAHIGAAAGGSALKNQADSWKQSLINDYSNLAIVNPGVEVSAVGPELDRLEAVIPGMMRARGLSAIFSETLYKQALSGGFDVIRSHTESITAHADENGRVTAATIIDALIGTINDLIRKIVIGITVVIGFFMALRLGLCFMHVAKEKKAAANGG